MQGLADDLALMDWLQEASSRRKKTVSPAFVRAGTRLAALEMIRSGTTTYADICTSEEEIARVTKAAGLRGVLSGQSSQYLTPDAGRGLSRTERFIKEFASDDLIVPAVAPHAMYTLEAETLKSARQLADREHVPVILHLAETQDEVRIAAEQHKATPVGYLESLGFFGPRTLAAHAVHLTTQDIEILRKRGVGVSHNPESNMKLASGTRRCAPPRRGACRPRHRWRRQQQRPRHVRVDAPGSPAAKLESGDPAPCRRRRHSSSDPRGGAALGMERIIGSLEPGAGRPDRRVDERRKATPMSRSCHTSSMPLTETT